MAHQHCLRRLAIVAILLVGEAGIPGSGTSAEGISCANPDQPPQRIELDGVRLEICAPFLPEPVFNLPAAGNAIQIAYALDRNHPGKGFSIQAIPFGKKSPVEAFPRVDSADPADAYLAILRQERLKQGGNPQPGPPALLFGRKISGLASLIPYPDGQASRKLLRITEWVAKSMGKLWLIRASQTVGERAAASRQPQLQIDEALDTRIWADGGEPMASSAEAQAIDTLQPQSLDAASLDVPWWNGECNTNHYAAAPNNPQKLPAYPLGAAYKGIIACGPRPWSDGAPSVLVRFYPGSWGEFEWECVELTMRFLYLIKGIAPYQANGNTVVQNYSGIQLVKIANGTVGIAPQPDDVLSYCATCTVGHSSVVTSSQVDATGNGFIQVIEENNSPTGQSTLQVANWVVQGNSGDIIGWLHDPKAQSAPPVQRLFLPMVSVAIS